jgi:hypothetical protein
MLPSNKGLFGKRNWDINAMKKLFDEFQKENQTALFWVQSIQEQLESGIVPDWKTQFQSVEKIPICGHFQKEIEHLRKNGAPLLPTLKRFKKFLKKVFKKIYGTHVAMCPANRCCLISFQRAFLLLFLWLLLHLLLRELVKWRRFFLCRLHHSI